MPKVSRPKIAVAMSGGVDSSVAAALLVAAGHAVVGIYAHTWTSQPGDGTDCTWVADRRDALRVAAHLDMPLVTLDLEDDYRAGVVEPLFAGYGRGITPNPDVLCNRIIKFGALWQAAQKLGATVLATGHYARIKDPGSTKSQAPNPQLLRGVDATKDQSYFLWDIPSETLPHILFPIGDYPKTEVRQLAATFGLPTATKKDSQGICFLGQTDLKTFLQTRIAATPGPIRASQTGEELGRHDGAVFVTIGQRHGIGTLHQSSAEPLFVVAKDTETNTVWVGPKAALYHDALTARALNWLDPQILATLQAGSRVTAQVQVRYHQPPVRAELKLADSELKIRAEEPIFAPAIGQSVVFYDGDRLLGGGIIASVSQPVVSMVSALLNGATLL